jgi:hypothetical protein
MMMVDWVFFLGIWSIFKLGLVVVVGCLDGAEMVLELLE